MRSMSKCLEVYQTGDRLDDDELSALAKEMHALAEASFQFGDVFRLQAAYAYRVAQDCNSFMLSRRARANCARKE